MVAPIAETTAELFYGRLFEIGPELVPLFGETDMKEQGRKLMGMLAMVVAGLDRFDSLRPAVENLGRRHVEYRVKPEDYQTAGQALLCTLERELGDAYTPDVAQAWTAAYSALSATILAASETTAGEGEMQPAAVEG